MGVRARGDTAAGERATLPHVLQLLPWDFQAMDSLTYFIFLINFFMVFFFFYKLRNSECCINPALTPPHPHPHPAV